MCDPNAERVLVALQDTAWLPVTGTASDKQRQQLWLLRRNDGTGSRGALAHHGVFRPRKGRRLAKRGPTRRVTTRLSTVIVLSTLFVGLLGVTAAQAEPPSITSFSPMSGPVGTLVTITGTNFTTPVVTEVEFNGLNDETFKVESGTTITATVPSGARNGPIQVTNADGRATSPAGFVVTPTPAPTIRSFKPTSGPVGTLVVITGTNLTGATAVSFNQVEATPPTVNSSTQITATVPTEATSGLISVTTPGGTETSTTNFTVAPPVVVAPVTPGATASSPTATVPSEPDLAITSIEPSGELARAMLITVAVTNQGVGESGRFLVRVESASGYVRKVVFPSLGAEEDARHIFRIPIQKGFPGGTERFTISVDSEGLVDESDEGNNVGFRDLVIPSRPVPPDGDGSGGSWVPWIGAAAGLVILVALAGLARRSSRPRRRRQPRADRVRATLQMDKPEVRLDVVDRQDSHTVALVPHLDRGVQHLEKASLK